jgi:hypothetical protein
LEGKLSEITFSGEKRGKTWKNVEKRGKTKLICLLKKRQITSVNCVFSVEWVGSQLGKIEENRRKSKKMERKTSGKSGEKDGKKWKKREKRFLIESTSRLE